MKQTGIATIFVGLLLVCNAQKAEENFYKGVEAVKQLRYTEAISYFSRAIKSDSKLTEAWYNRALTKSKLNYFNSAIEDYSIAISLDPSMAKAYLNRGADLKETGHIKNAIADYTKAIEIDSAYILAYYNRGIIYYQLHNYQKALADFGKAVVLDSAMTDGWYNLGLVCKKLQQKEKAIRYFSKVIVMNPKHDKAIKQRAVCFLQAADYNNAIADLKQILLLNENDCEAWMLLGSLAQELNAIGEERIILAKAKALGCTTNEKPVELFAQADTKQQLPKDK